MTVMYPRCLIEKLKGERNVDVFLDFVVGDKPAGIPQWKLID